MTPDDTLFTYIRTLARESEAFGSRTGFVRIACEALHIGIDDVTGPARFRRIAICRHAICAALVGRGMSTPQAGRMLGGRHHTTALHATMKALACLRPDIPEAYHTTRVWRAQWARECSRVRGVTRPAEIICFPGGLAS